MRFNYATFGSDWVQFGGIYVVISSGLNDLAEALTFSCRCSRDYFREKDVFNEFQLKESFRTPVVREYFFVTIVTGCLAENF